MKKILIFLTLFLFARLVQAGEPGKGIAWQAWSQDLFAQAKKENRLVLLDLEAVWCHWCHVMETQTYADPKVQALIQDKFIAVKVDQDSRPDLSNRYQDYGWPATILFDPQGGELSKNRGFLAPEELLSILNLAVKDPAALKRAQDKPKIEISSQGVLTDPLRAQLEQRHRDAYDREKGGLKLAMKFLDAGSVEYAMLLGREGDAEQEWRARQYLDNAMQLLDPVWGGVYQYSTNGDWSHPHFEKVMSFQSDNLRIYSLAYSIYQDAKYLETARQIANFLEKFLRSPDGAFYTSMDADLKPGEHSAEYFALDDAGRRAQGIPRIDPHRYARENGWVIDGLVQLYLASGEKKYFEEAKQAARWVLANRSLAANNFESARYLAIHGLSPSGGFKHDAQDTAGPYLGDNLAMGRAFLSLYLATADRDWLKRSTQTAGFIQRHFGNKTVQGVAAGYWTSEPGPGMAPVLVVDENIALARWTNLLSHYTGDKQWKTMAENAMKYLATPGVALERMTEAGILLADRELRQDPTHITVVGAKGDTQAQALFAAAASFPSGYKRVEWWDQAEGPMPNPDVQYPQLDKSAAFVCANKTCSSPVFLPEKIGPLVLKLAASKKN